MINRTGKVLAVLGIVAASVVTTTVVAQAEPGGGATGSICLVRLLVEDPQETTGGDEPYLKVNDKMAWDGPNSMKKGQAAPIYVTVPIGQHLEVFEDDGPSGDDYIDGVNATAGKDRWAAERKGVKYEIRYHEGAC